MRKLLFFVLVSSLFSTTAFSKDLNAIDKRVIENFRSEHEDVAEVNWFVTETFTKASFVENEQKVEVFYNLEGDYMATTRQLPLEKLPLSIKKVVAKKYDNYLIEEAFTLEADFNTDYFISLQNKEHDLVLQIHKGAVTIFSTSNKSGATF